MSELMNGNGRAEGTGAPAKAWEKTVETDRIETTETASSAAPASHDPKALDAHAAAGHHLIPIDGKKPVGHGWTRSAPMSLDQAKARYNVDCR
jgi:hypothetical protein